jgi:hypothetical protein
MKITITIGEIELTATLADKKIAEDIYNALPLETAFSTWGDEIYFRIPIATDLDGVTDVLDVGELAFWPPGSAFCIFFGRTPASVENEPRAASQVIPFGRIDKDAELLRSVSGSKIQIDRLES